MKNITTSVFDYIMQKTYDTCTEEIFEKLRKKIIYSLTFSIDDLPLRGLIESLKKEATNNE